MIAAQRGHGNMIRFLLELGADINAVNTVVIWLDAVVTSSLFVCLFVCLFLFVFFFEQGVLFRQSKILWMPLGTIETTCVILS